MNGREPGGLLVAVGPERSAAQWLRGRAGVDPQWGPGLSWLPAEPGPDRLTPDRLTVLRAGRSTLLLHGPDVPAAHHQQMLRAVGTADSATAAAVVRELPGAYVVVARFGDRTECWGPVTGLRRIAWTVLPDGVVLVADRARVLARLTGAGLDDTALAIRLLEPVPHPLGERCCWRGVQLVPAGHLLRLEADRAPVVRSAWQAPEPAVPLVEAAPRVAAALTAAVRAAAGDGGTVTTELSGGYDSSAVTTLAARLGPPGRRLVAITSGGRGLNGDEAWARRLAGGLPGLEHHVLPADRLPLVYDEPAGDGAGASPIANLDEPSVALACRAMVGAIAAWARGHGSTAHLTGHGGDHLFVAVPTLVRDLLRRRPVLAAQRLATYRAMFGWPLPAVAAQLADRRSYAAWLAAALDPPGRYAQTVVDERTPILDWGPPLAVPAWLTPYGRELVLDALATPPAAGAEPLAPGHGRHAELDGIRAGARLTAATVDLAAAEGLALRAPMFDDRLLEAVLSVRLEDRVDPWTYKPVLAAAVRGVVPDAILARTTKDEGSADVELGLRRNAHGIRMLWSDSRLAERGLVDADRLSVLCRSWDAPELADGSLSTTIAAELWLRAQDAARPGGVGAPIGRTHVAGRHHFAGEDLG